MRTIDIHKTALDPFTDDQLSSLQQWLALEIEDAAAIRKVLENHWRDLLRMYEGVPKNPVRNYPVENAPNLEITLGAIAVDALYAQIVDLIFTITPLITCRPVPKLSNDTATENTSKALQRWVNWMAANELDLRNVCDDVSLSDLKVGNGIVYIPMIERRKKTKIAKVLSSHPQMFPVPPEDFITPMGAVNNSLQELRWCAMRTWPTRTELFERAQRNNWNLGPDECNIKAIGVKDWVKNRREALGRQFEGMRLKGNIFEIWDVYCFFDIDGDGVDEDIYCVFDRTSKRVLFASWNPYDYRPFEKCSYQKREHLFWGMGVLEMVKPFEEGASDFYNYWTLNSLQANTRDIFAKAGVLPDNWVRWPGKVTEVDGEPSLDVVPIQMHSTDASLPQAIAMTISFCERRVGLNDMNTPRPFQVLGSRTPGITALTLLQQVNKRFTPAFDDVKLCITNSIKQGLYRYQEALQRKDSASLKFMEHILEVLGPEDGDLVINILLKPSFDKEVDVELTASTASVNREADRQNAIILINTLLPYYDKAMQLIMFAANPQVPEAIRSVAKKIAHAVNEIIDRTLRTFDSTRDPGAFIIDMDAELDALELSAQEQQAMAPLMQLLGQVALGTGREQVRQSGGAA